MVQEGLPVSKNSDWVNLSTEKEIKVPADAWVDWDAATQKFITAGREIPQRHHCQDQERRCTTSPDLWKTTWHDGSPMSVGDFVMQMIMTFDPGKEEVQDLRRIVEVAAWIPS